MAFTIGIGINLVKAMLRGTTNSNTYVITDYVVADYVE